MSRLRGPWGWRPLARDGAVLLGVLLTAYGLAHL